MSASAPATYDTLAPLMRLSLELERAGYSIGVNGGDIAEAIEIIRRHILAGHVDGLRQRDADIRPTPNVIEFRTDSGAVCRLVDEVTS